MSLSDELQRALGARAAGYTDRDWSSPRSVTELSRMVAENAGRPARFGNGILAGLLGVSIRQVQRYQKEPGSGQHRPVSEDKQAAMAGIAESGARQAVARDLRQQADGSDGGHGLSVSIGGTLEDPSDEDRERDPISVEFDPEDEYFEEFLQSLAYGNAQQQADAFNGAFMSAYGLSQGFHWTDPDPFSL